MEFTLAYDPPHTNACGPAMPGMVRCSLARHSKHGVAIVSCYHGVAYMALACPCGIKHRAILLVPAPLVPGLGVPPNVQQFPFIVDPIDPPDRDRDVAWFMCPLQLLHLQARTVATAAVGLNELMEVQTGFGAFTHQVVGLPLRGGHEELLLSQSRVPRGGSIPSSFSPGQSGSPVVNRSGELVAVVRDNAGHCGRVVV